MCISIYDIQLIINKENEKTSRIRKLENRGLLQTRFLSSPPCGHWGNVSISQGVETNPFKGASSTSFQRAPGLSKELICFILLVLID